MKKYKYSISKVSDNCPERLAYPSIEEVDIYYRIVSVLPIKKIDFVPHYYLPAERKKREGMRSKQKLSGNQLCRLCSISLFKNIDDFMKMSETNLKLKEKIVVAGSVCGLEHGLILQSASKNYPSHYDWFPYTGVQEIELFKKVIDICEQ